MAFLLYKTDDGRVPPTEYLPGDGNVRRVGEALCTGDNGLERAAGAVKPTYISMAETSASAVGSDAAVMRVQPDMIFETTASAAMDALGLGEKVTIASDGLQVTATTASGVAEIVSMDGTAAGSKVRVRFS